MTYRPDLSDRAFLFHLIDRLPPDAYAAKDRLRGIAERQPYVKCGAYAKVRSYTGGVQTVQCTEEVGHTDEHRCVQDRVVITWEDVIEEEEDQ